MRTISTSILVVGSGFGGSLTALILARQGHMVVMADVGHHPRFAIGESSTPTGNRILRALCQRYGLDDLLPLTSFGTWQRDQPNLVGGVKRGFSYFAQTPNEPYSSDANHSRELLVTANSNREQSDTHWLRSDVDSYFCELARRAGVLVFSDTRLEVEQHTPRWRCIAKPSGSIASPSEDEPFAIEADFLIDGSGSGEFVASALLLPRADSQLQTRSRAVFAHFRGVRPWQQVLAERDVPTSDYPFPCDDAALHHVVDEGWMWQLRFVNDVVSVGWCIDLAQATNGTRNSNENERLVTGEAPGEEFARILSRYPSVQSQFDHAVVVAPAGGVCRSGRLQRLFHQAAGRNWAMLPSTAGFIDPLFSTGIAHTLAGVERLTGLFEEVQDILQNLAHFEAPLRDYATTLQQEFHLIDACVSAAYQTRHNFERFVLATMLYFVGATSFERTRTLSRQGQGWLQPGSPGNPAFLCAHDEALSAAISAARIELLAAGSGAPETKRVTMRCRELLKPWNTAGLFDDSVRNLYRYTAAD